MMDKFNQISSKYIFRNPYWDYKFDKYVLPDKTEGDYYYVETPGSVMIIPLTKDNKVIFVRQFRYLNQKYSLEFPGGGIKINSSPIDNAIAELREEAGIISKNISKIGEFNPFNGVTNEICNVFIAEDIEFVNSSPDNSEEFDIITLNFNEINQLIKKNEIWDGMTLSAWSLYYFSNILE
jgi:ADP-ribose pyrophosphatase